MTIRASSAKVSRAIDCALRPVLVANGFSKFKGRTAYRYEGDTIFGFTTAAVGTYFSEITGFTPASFTATLWVNFQAIPERAKPSIDRDGLALPTAMHRYLELLSDLDSQERLGVKAGPELSREDIWWVHPGGENLSLLTRDLAAAFEHQAADWISLYLNKERLLALVDSEGDCFGKYEFMYHMAQSIGHAAYAQKYEELCFRLMPKYIRDMLRERGYEHPML